MSGGSGEFAFCIDYLNGRRSDDHADGLRARQFGFAFLGSPATSDAAAQLLENLDALDRALLSRSKQEEIDLRRQAGVMALEQLRAVLP